MKFHKRKPAGAAGMLPAVVDRAERIRLSGKLMPQHALIERASALPDATPDAFMGGQMPEGRAPSDPLLKYMVGVLMPANSAWMHISRTIEALATDPKVSGVPAAVEFVEVVAAAARNAILAESAADALKPIDERMTQSGSNRGQCSPKVGLFVDLRARFPGKGPTALADHISVTVGKGLDPAIDRCFRVDSRRQLIDRQSGRPVTTKALTEQIKKAIQRAQR